MRWILEPQQEVCVRTTPMLEFYDTKKVLNFAQDAFVVFQEVMEELSSPVHEVQ
jgi:hypothetical protein